MATFQQASDADVQLLRQVVEKYHPRLIGVDIGLLEAYAPCDADGNVRPGATALKVHGIAAYATVKINSLADRVEGKPDATIRIDADVWGAHSDKRKVAILDHELAHLLLATDKDGNVKRDDLGRPKLKMRYHDLVVGGFSDVVERHGAAAVESMHYLDVHKFFSQQTFPWG